MGKLSGKVALVTGASKGIGASIAKALAAEGASVAVNYAGSKDGADQVVAEIAAKGGKAVAVQGNVSKSADVTRLFDEAKRALGPVDILVNNAGIYEMAPIADVTEEHFRRHFDINVLGLLLATQEAVKQFGDRGGSVINISSVVSTITPPGLVVYSATKGAVDSVTHTLAKELGSKKIRVNSINPGLIQTEGTRTAGMVGSDFEKETIARAPLGRAGVTQDIAPIAVFLASDDAGWVSGETIIAAGGIR
jgi:3-oxoacyl-[acyl-carrier protein] reductase